MENKQPLLSICIPTYNRCEYLQGAICNIISDKSFDFCVEIIISDNASTDRTQEIGEEFANKHNNIMYYRNNCNIQDENFFLSLQRAHGKYVRLFNDTLRFKNGALKRMLQEIESMSESSLLLFFQNSTFLNLDKKISIYNINQFIAQTSFHITWIGNFGIWRKNMDLIQNPNRCSKIHLAQVDWYLQIVSKSDGGIIYYSDFFESIAPKQKGGYNLFEVFINNYLLILHSYLDKKIKSL
ncbi:Abequosyltransferase RfbV, partial [termite gut metagenome]